MAVDATELRPRGAVALFDASVRLVTTSSGLWALTLPSGVALVAAGVAVVDAARAHQSTLMPAAWWTLAWVFRALSQGAACFYAEQQILGTSEPTVWSAWRAALGRAPSLIISCALLLVVSVCIMTFTLGIGFFFFGAHAVGYAVAMRGQGHPFKLIATSAALLGPSRLTAGWVRACGAVQLLLALNLHLFVALSLKLASELIGLELTFASRFVSITNPVWLAVLLLITFTCFEPIRAASAALLLIDGRVRQEALDLVAAVGQLRSRKKKTIALALAMLLAPQAHAATELGSRLERVAKQCRFSSRVDREALADFDSLNEKERGAATRFVNRVERDAIDNEDCESAEAEVISGLQQLRAARKLQVEVDAEASRADAQAILARPEFQTVPPTPEADEEKAADEEESWFWKWWDRVWDALRDFLKDNRSDPPDNVSNAPLGGPLGAASVVMVLVLVLIVLVVVVLVMRFAKKDETVGPDVATSPLEEGLSSDPMSALSRPARTWASLADELAARGEYREAIRHLYLALLARLHAEGRITYDPSRSNWEYLRELKASAAVKGAFRELTRRFDFAWYGHLLVDSLSYGTFRELTAPLLAEQSTEGALGA